MEQALGWPAGTAQAVADGAELPETGSVRENTLPHPASWRDDPDLISRLPEQIREELSGQLLGVDVVDLGPTEAGTRMVVIVKRDSDVPDLSPEALREVMEEWQRKRRELWRPSGEDRKA